MDQTSVNLTLQTNTSSFEIGDSLFPTWSVNVIIVVNVIIMVLAVTGNGVILIVEQFNKQKTSTDWMVTFMSANDLFLAGWNTPIYILFYGGNWANVGSDVLCGIMYYVQETLSYSSTLLITATAIDRYIKTCHPLTTGITPRKSMFICIGITIFTMGFSSPIPIFMEYDTILKCKYNVTDSSVKTVFRVIVVVVEVTFVLMFVVVIVSYCKIALTIRRRHRKMMQTSVHLQLASTGTTASESGNVSTRISRLISTRSERNKVTPLSTLTKDAGTCSRDTVMPGTLQRDNNETNSDQAEPRRDLSKDAPEMNVNSAPFNRYRQSKEIQMNRTTVIMFAVTIVFILSWIPTWIASVIWPRRVGDTVGENLAFLFCRRSFMINTCTNPLFYIGMSSGFRKLTQETMRKIWYRIQYIFLNIDGFTPTWRQ